MSSITSKAIKIAQRKSSDHRWKQQLRECEKKIEQPLQSLSHNQIREIRDYYSKFGFKSVSTDWHRYIYSVSGEYSPKFIPEDFFHGVLENTYNNRSFYGAWEDKAFMPHILDCVNFPETICCNVNGYYYDKNRKLITFEQAKRLVYDYGDGFAKPTLASGGGRGAFLINENNTEDVFRKLNRNFIVQKRIIQSPEMASFNPSSVNTEKIVSLMFNGEVHILSAIMRVGAEEAITDAAASGKGYFFGIRDDGTASGIGMNVFGKKREKDYYGNPIEEKKLSHHKEICDLVKKAHTYFPYFGFMSWDFCVNENNQVMLIEYNTGYPVAMVYQMVTGPFLGNITDLVLKDVARKYKRC